MANADEDNSGVYGELYPGEYIHDMIDSCGLINVAVMV